MHNCDQWICNNVNRNVVGSMAEWLRPVIFSTPNHSPSHCCSSSLARVTRETSQVLLVGGQGFFLRDLPFSPHLTTDLAQNV